MIVTNYTPEDLKKLPLRAIVALTPAARGESSTWLSCRMTTRRRSVPGGRGERHPAGRGLCERIALPVPRIRGPRGRGESGCRGGRFRAR